MVLMLQCLIMAPYFVLDGRVKNTFTNEPDPDSALDRFVRPFSAAAGKLYAWLAKSGKKVFLYTIAFLVLVVALDVLVDSIVLYVVLR
jgi:hypothetical protein